MFTIRTSFKQLFLGGGGGGRVKSVEVTANSKEENSLDFILTTSKNSASVQYRLEKLILNFFEKMENADP
jgi:hypothetical protein